MSKNIFYEVMQNSNGVGFFRKKSNAKRYLKEFNTKVKIAPLKIVERYFLDDDFEKDLNDGFYDGGINWDVWKKSP
jgi:hypothetical protein